jgi:integrase
VKLWSLRAFATYIAQSGITGITQITRKFILSFLTCDKQNIDGKRQRLGTLRDFFWIGTVKGWFTADPDLIQDDDFPKKKKGNPDPISDVVREQIEQNLQKLPDPIARMWIICFFTAMRPVELSLLRKNCLVQEGSHWKLRWWRKKGKDEHEVPITRVIAKVVQEQIDYIDQLWGADWEYLFCHYRGISKSGKDPSFPSLSPIRRVLPCSHNPFSIAIRCLIQSEDIRDENGHLATFSPRLVRHTRLTQLFAQGHDLAVVSAWAGHKSLAVTGTFYTQVSCDQIADETGAIQVALFNAEGHTLNYESLPKSFWQKPRAHELNLTGDHINTPIYGFCGLPLDKQCDKFRACYTCPSFLATTAKLPLYIKTCDELRMKEARARESGQAVLVEQFGRQADQLDKIIARIQEAP